MERVWEFFENMDEFVYVADIDSHELIYMNKKMLEVYGFHSLEEVHGKKCYEVIQKCSVPCALCNNEELISGYFKEWSCFSPILNRHLVLKDTIIEADGRRCRIELALDADTPEWQSSIIRGCRNMETFANEVLCHALQASTPDKAIGIILEYLGKALKGDRTYIFEQNERGGDDNTYEWVAKGITSEKDRLQNLPPEVCAGWYQSFKEGKNIVIENLQDIRKTNPQQYEILKRQNIRSLVVVPLYDDRKNIGFCGIDNPSVEFLDYASNMLQIMGNFITSSLKKRNLIKMLQHMSYTDQLTKFGNRYAMNAYIENMPEEENNGVVFCDVTGLKRINDTKGHREGDRLILRASESLRRVFDGYGLFRIGGDEFLVICPKIEEEELSKKIGTLKKDMQENFVTMAVGAIWRKGGRKNIEQFMTESEKLMYEDKADYYRARGMDRRR